jgi:hypothetical protein
MLGQKATGVNGDQIGSDGEEELTEKIQDGEAEEDKGEENLPENE